MPFIEITTVTEMPVTLAETKLHLRVTDTSDDTYITLLIKAVTLIIEKKTRNLLIRRNCRAFFDQFDYELFLPVAPVSAVLEINYYLDGVRTLLASTIYDADVATKTGRIKAAEQQYYPYIDSKYNSVEVDFTVGYGTTAAAIPENIKAAILYLVGHFYTNREPVINGISVLSSKIPFTFEYILGTFKYIRV